jgi:hypothetical protein
MQMGNGTKRPIFILLGLIFFFTIPYAKAISIGLRAENSRPMEYGKFGFLIEDEMIWARDKPEEILDSINPWFCLKMDFISAFSPLSILVGGN